MTMTATKSEAQQEALGRAVNGQPNGNYFLIIDGFCSRGIAVSDIRPRENVFTYKAWQALNRQVRKGEGGVRVQTWIENKKTGKRFPKATTVFHVSQTDAAAIPG